jgi:hypothetical protein
LQFGKTTVTGVFSEQNHRQKCVYLKVEVIQDFDMFALDYDSRHFYVSILETNTSLNYPFMTVGFKYQD